MEGYLVRRRVQISFLSAFLTLLAIAFAAALVVRARSYSGRTTTESPASAPTAAGTSAARSSRRTDGLSGDEPLPAGVTASTTRDSAETNARAAARAKRFRELLALGAPKLDVPVSPVQTPVKTVPVPVVAKPQTPISRPTQAASNAFRGSGVSGSAGNGGQPPSSNKANTGTNDPKDPNSDTVPPQLISIAFDPPQVQAGGDTTLIITATDDLSGIRGISGTLTSPNGKAVQGFAQQRDGETTRYVSRIHIPEKAEEGIWKITFLTMSDMATNSVTLSAGQGTLPPTAVLKVTSSASDSTAPTLRNVWLERGAMRAGEHNTLYVDAQDDKSGVHSVTAVFLSPSKLARFGAGCHTGANSVWECDVSPPQCLDCGDWTLDQVNLQDNANNFAVIRSENPAVQQLRLNITGDTCDNQPPALQGLALSRTEIVMGRDEPVIEFVAQVSDDSCGMGGVSGQIAGPSGSSSGTFFTLQQRDATTFVGTVRLHPNSARGVWRMQSITVNDKGQNLKIYSSSDPLLANAIFRVK